MGVKALQRFGTLVFSEMTELAREYEAVNLGQGFPDFDGPEAVHRAAFEAMRAGHNQYARSMGVPEMVRAVSRHQKRFYDLDVDPMTEVCVFCGASEALATLMAALLEPGDEVLTFEPHYSTYGPGAVMAGATLKTVTLEFPDFGVDLAAVERAIGPRTRMLLLNTPHNPTGKVFTRDELNGLAQLCRRHDLWVVSDEVYEHIVFEGHSHVPIATLDGMWERTVTVSTFGKTFAMTGWKLGWASGPRSLIEAAQTVHQNDSFCVATPLQHGAAAGLDALAGEYLDGIRSAYEARRAHLLESLRAIGLEVPDPGGAYFLLADFSKVFEGDSLEYARHLVEKAGVVGIPPQSFYTEHPQAGDRLLRFAFCKTLDTLTEARRRLWAAYGVDGAT